MVEKNCKYCGKKIKNCYNTQKYHKECFKQRKKEYMKEYFQKPEVKQRKKEYMKEYFQKPEVKQRMKEKYFTIKNNWENLSEKKQLELMNRKAKEILSNSSPPVRTSDRKSDTKVGFNTDLKEVQK